MSGRGSVSGAADPRFQRPEDGIHAGGQLHRRVGVSRLHPRQAFPVIRLLPVRKLQAVSRRNDNHPLLALDNVIVTPHLSGSPRWNSLDDIEEVIVKLGRALSS